MSQAVAIISGKGGVGKTTVALNLAAALRRLGHDPIVLEGNVTSPTAGLYLGFMPARRTINNVLNDGLSLDEVILEHESGVRLVTCSLSLAELEQDYSDAFALVPELKKKTDLLLIDAAAGLDEEARLAITASDFVLVVTNPEMPAIIDALRAIRLARALKRKVLGVVVNKVNPREKQVSIEEIESIVEAPVLAAINEDRSVKDAFVYNCPVVFHNPTSRVGMQVFDLASKIAGGDDDFVQIKESIAERLKRAFSFVFR